MVKAPLSVIFFVILLQSTRPSVGWFPDRERTTLWAGWDVETCEEPRVLFKSALCHCSGAWVTELLSLCVSEDARYFKSQGRLPGSADCRFMRTSLFFWGRYLKCGSQKKIWWKNFCSLSRMTLRWSAVMIFFCSSACVPLCGCLTLSGAPPWKHSDSG